MKIRHLKVTDAKRIYEWMVDPDVNRFFWFSPNDVNVESIIKFIENAQIDKDNIHLACVNEEDQYLGTVSLKNISKINKNAEFAMSFRKETHGTGAARFAASEILRIGFEELGLEKIYLYVPKENKRAIAFYEKMNFVFEGEFRKHLYIRGDFVSLRWYALLSSEWKTYRTTGIS